MSTNKLLVTRSAERPRVLSASETPLEDPDFIVIETKRSLFSLSLIELLELLAMLVSILVLVAMFISGNTEWVQTLIWALIGLVATLVEGLFIATKHKRFIENYSKKFREPSPLLLEPTIFSASTRF